MVDRWLTATLAVVAAIGLAACGGDTGGEVQTVTVPAVQDTTVTGDAILSETRISSAAKHTGEVLSGSFIGESAFCPGSKTSGGDRRHGHVRWSAPRTAFSSADSVGSSWKNWKMIPTFAPRHTASTGAIITTTFRCPDGRLIVRYSPTQPSLGQGAAWEVVSGTGGYKVCAAAARWWPRSEAKIQTKAGRPSPGRSASRRGRQRHRSEGWTGQVAGRTERRTRVGERIGADSQVFVRQ
jgi:hypothetical protein